MSRSSRHGCGIGAWQSILLYTDPMGLHGQTALVTGASRGLGKAIARRLAREGAAVAVNYKTRGAEAEAVVEEIRAAGGRAAALRADIGDPAQVKEMTNRVQSELGPPSILVNNAGVVYRATLESFDSAGMQQMRRTNVDGLIHMTQAVVAGHEGAQVRADRESVVDRRTRYHAPR